MHPWIAVWIWSMAMSRAWQESLSVGGASNDNAQPPADTAPIIVPANAYLKTEIVDQMLPALLLDRLADLHWLEQEPALAI